MANGVGAIAGGIEQAVSSLLVADTTICNLVDC